MNQQKRGDRRTNNVRNSGAKVSVTLDNGTQIHNLNPSQITGWKPAHGNDLAGNTVNSAEINYLGKTTLIRKGRKGAVTAMSNSEAQALAIKIIYDGGGQVVFNGQTLSAPQ